MSYRLQLIPLLKRRLIYPGLFTGQLQILQQALEASKARVKDIWKMSCEQVEEFEETNIAKYREIAD